MKQIFFSLVWLLLSSHQTNGDLVTFSVTEGSQECVNLPDDPTGAGYSVFDDCDDCSTGAVPLGFDFDFYGNTKTTTYINSNGNLSFDAPFYGYVSSGFPITTPMIAAFWTDIDLRDSKGADSAIYYRNMGDKFVVTFYKMAAYSGSVGLHNTFQVVLYSNTAENAASIGGINVLFCFAEMQWVYSSPATVGVNAGDGVNFVQLGRFQSLDNVYDGAEGNPDGIQYLTEKESFSVNAASTEVGPIQEAPTSNAGAGGDPHFTTWNGHRYDFHGHCDLVLLKSPHFGMGHTKHAQEQGLAVHIRSAPYKMVYSYISDMAIQVGHNILEIGSGGHHTINGEPQTIGATGMLGDYHVGSTYTKNGRYIYRVHLGDHREKKYHGQELYIREYKEWISIEVKHPCPADFVDSVGLMGSFPRGTWYGRDGVSIHDHIDDFGNDWIVQGDFDGYLFDVPSPFPDKCNLPSLKDMATKHRRLSTASVSRAQAVEACTKYVRFSSPAALESCVMDVLISEDLEMAVDE
eukprot:scaffold1322_cov185-Amphora_coffeaeformis.AAC.2